MAAAQQAGAAAAAEVVPQAARRADQKGGGVANATISATSAVAQVAVTSLKAMPAAMRTLQERGRATVAGAVDTSRVALAAAQQSGAAAAAVTGVSQAAQ